MKNIALGMLRGVGHIIRTCGLLHAASWYHGWWTVEKETHLIWEGLNEINDLQLTDETLWPFKDLRTENAYQKDRCTNCLCFMIERRSIPRGGVKNTPHTGDEKPGELVPIDSVHAKSKHSHQRFVRLAILPQPPRSETC